jgi:hypothetical protein
MRWASLFAILLAAPCAACLAQQVTTAGNPADGSKSVKIAIQAREPYKQGDGSPFTPRLELRCEETSAGKRSVIAVLATGGIEIAASNDIESLTGPVSRSGRKSVDITTVNYSDERPFHDPRMSFDDGKSTVASRRLNIDKDLLIIPGSEFLKGALKAQTVSLSFPALGESNQADIVSRFDLSGFKAEFDKHPECSIK